MNIVSCSQETLIFFMKTTYFGLILIAITLFFSTGSKKASVIYWSDEHRLTWNDFKGQPQHTDADFDALTASGIVDYKGCKEGKITYKVRAYFEPENSWVKDAAHTDYHLAHEQLHFDITELYARKLRKLLVQQDFRCGEESRFENFVKANLESWYTEQKNYDIHTRHSMDTKKQEEWFYRIKIELTMLENYKE